MNLQPRLRRDPAGVTHPDLHAATGRRNITRSPVHQSGAAAAPPASLARRQEWPRADPTAAARGAGTRSSGAAAMAVRDAGADGGGTGTVGGSTAAERVGRPRARSGLAGFAPRTPPPRDRAEPPAPAEAAPRTPGHAGGPRSDPRGDQRLHQPQGHPGIKRVLGRKLAPPLDRPEPVAALLGPPGQALERGGIVPGESRTLLLQPALEFRRLREMEAVEEGAAIFGGGPLELPRLDGGGEGGEIAGDQVGIEPEIPACPGTRRPRPSPDGGRRGPG